ncbi:hypothetical protein CLOSTMETH_01466 [[Clostridium] methylpentosum DSM 5476]|uniref:Uncharacterized protein n=1 Tax=[Clostridium] methylpentosum DSM 5476 TaxID=537013 RepID=C0EC97_9FIRM|nr:hypothetical protein CLOSTMETH_01466 [[Clostridium] methylpentosum DSM 5476]
MKRRVCHRANLTQRVDQPVSGQREKVSKKQTAAGERLLEIGMRC